VTTQSHPETALNFHSAVISYYINALWKHVNYNIILYSSYIIPLSYYIKLIIIPLWKSLQKKKNIPGTPPKRFGTISEDPQLHQDVCSSPSDVCMWLGAVARRYVVVTSWHNQGDMMGSVIPRGAVRRWVCQCWFCSISIAPTPCMTLGVTRCLVRMGLRSECQMKVCVFWLWPWCNKLLMLSNLASGRKRVPILAQGLPCNVFRRVWHGATII